MKDNFKKQNFEDRSKRNEMQTPMRVASRLKGVVKNLGIKKKKKPPKE